MRTGLAFSAVVIALGLWTATARADLIRSTAERDLSYDPPPVSSSTTVTDPVAGDSSFANLGVPDGEFVSLRAAQSFTGSGAKGYVEAGAVWVNGSQRNTITATNVL